MRPQLGLDTERIAQLYERMSLRAVAAELGCAHTTVWKRLRKHGIDTRPRTLPPTIVLSEDAISLSRVATWFDAEGYLGHRVLNIGNTSKPVVDFVRTVVGGGGSIQTGKTLKGTPYYIWRIFRIADIHILLSAILPYLMAKRDSAEEWLRLNTPQRMD